MAEARLRRALVWTVALLGPAAHHLRSVSPSFACSGVEPACARWVCGGLARSAMPRLALLQRFRLRRKAYTCTSALASHATHGQIMVSRLCRGWDIHQFVDGYRFNHDDILLAHTANKVAPNASRLLDLGAGIGSIGLMWLAQQPRDARLVAVEAQEASVGLYTRTVESCGLSARVDLLHGDIREPTVLEQLGGGFEAITANPPYHPSTGRLLPKHPQRRFCHAELRGGVLEFVAAAKSQLSNSGCLCLIHDHASEAKVMKEVESQGLRIEQVTTILSRGQPLRSLLVCRHEECASRGSPSRQSLAIRDEDGSWSVEFQEICRELDVFQKPE